MKSNSKNKKNHQNMTKFFSKVLILQACADKIIIKLGEKSDLELFVGNAKNAKLNSKGSFCFLKNQSLSVVRECEQDDVVKKNWQHRKKDGCKMISVVSAANYLISLFYNSDRYCRSAVIQKLLVIAQMKSIYHDGELLFCDDITVKESCFSIDFISKTYPNVIFDGEHKEKEEITSEDDLLLIKDEISTPKCFFKVDDIPERERNILRETYQHFGRYSGDCIGKVMCKLSLHKNYLLIGKIESDTQLKTYLNAIPDEDKENPVVSFVISNENNS